MGKVLINKENCKGCYLCIDVCPKKILQKSRSMNSQGFFTVEINGQKSDCIGCAFCATRCPHLAILEVYR